MTVTTDPDAAATGASDRSASITAGAGRSLRGRAFTAHRARRPTGRPAGFAAALLLCLATLFHAGCATLPDPGPRPETRAFDRPDTTPLGRAMRSAAPGPGLSGLRLVETGTDAFDARLRLTREARVSLDLQYFLVRDDDATHALLAEIRAAAERGVRVRLLIDDLHTAGRDRALAAWADHPNIALRLFNPFAGGRDSPLARWLGGLGDFERVNRRMHNKVFIADSAVAVAGGRNLGAEYFLRSPTQNFADLDLLVAGPVVTRLAAVFDQFWNSPAAYPLHALTEGEAGTTGAAGATGTAGTTDATTAGKAATTGTPGSPGPATPSARAAGSARGPTLAALLGALGALTWAPARLLADPPDKALDGDASGRPVPTEPASGGASVVDSLDALMRAARREVLLVSPYFIPGAAGLETFRALRARGVRVRVLTNSLATTDATPVHGAWARYRPALLEMGVEVHELRPRPGRPRGLLKAFGRSLASLHAKALAIDGERMLVGSVNVDPRSARLNTELGLLVESPALARRLTELIEEDLAPDNAYRVVLQADGSLRWSSHGPNGERTDDVEPETTLWLRAFTRWAGAVVPEDLL